MTRKSFGLTMNLATVEVETGFNLCETGYSDSKHCKTQFMAIKSVQKLIALPLRFSMTFEPVMRNRSDTR